MSPSVSLATFACPPGLARPRPTSAPGGTILKLPDASLQAHPALESNSLFRLISGLESAVKLRILLQGAGARGTAHRHDLEQSRLPRISSSLP